MTVIPDLMNMGPKTTQWLKEIGIERENDLRDVGVIEAYIKVKANHPRRVNLMFLYALQGALMNMNCLHMPEEIKKDLQNQLANF